MKNQKIVKAIKQWFDNKTSWDFTEPDAMQKWAEELAFNIDLFIDPDWQVSPEWANYIATDWNGIKHAFENEPTCEKLRGVWLDNGGKWEVITFQLDNQLWVDSLKRRT